MNAYAVLSSPRASGTEAIVVSASRRSQTGAPNLRGVATVLALAAYLKGTFPCPSDHARVCGADMRGTQGPRSGPKTWSSS